MSIPILIAISFSLGFFIESIMGFGGGLIAYSILGFFMDIKSMVLAGLYIGTCSSAYIFISDYKSFAKTTFLKSFPICFLGVMIGVAIFTLIDSKSMLTIFGFLAIILSAKAIFFDKIKISKNLQNLLLLIGGLVQGLLGVGGPFIVNALKEKFTSKSQLRTTMALFFVSLNIVRFVQLIIQNDTQGMMISQIWWVIIPIFMAIYFGFKLHLKISEEFFKKMVAAMTLFAGIVFLFK